MSLSKHKLHHEPFKTQNASSDFYPRELLQEPFAQEIHYEVFTQKALVARRSFSLALVLRK